MDKYSLGIKSWAFEDRPREKLILKGIDALSDAELLAILIGSGNRTQSAVGLSRKILADVDNNLIELGKLSIKELCKNYNGIGQAKAITIAAAIELGKRRNSSDGKQLPKITSSSDVFRLLHPPLSDLKHEEFWVLILDRANRVIHKEKVTKGGVSSTVFDVRIILKSAIDRLASGIIICHNHPSENCNPSDADKKITYKMKEAGLLIDIQLLDHLIICGSKYFSFADEGLL